MTNVRELELGELMPKERRSSVNPADYPGEAFELLSIPAYDRGAAEIALGSEIGSTKQAVQPGDVLLSKIVPHIRRAWVVEQSSGSRQIASSEWIVFRSKEVDARYLRHFLISDRFHRQFMQTVSGVGGSLLRARPKYVAKIRIPIPPLEEQRRIAAILDRASQIDALCDTAIDQHRALDESLFLHFFADLDSGRFSSLKHLSSKKSNSIRTGPFGSQLLHSEFTDSGVAVLGIDNAVKNEFSWAKNRFISPEKYEQLKRYTVNPGDVLITIMGTCGRVAVVPEDIPVAINTKHLCAISLDHSQVLPDYLHKFILYHPAAKRYLKQRTKGAIMGGLNMGIIKELPVLVPSLSSQLEWLHQKNTAQRTHQKALTAKAQSLSLKTSLANSFVEAANP